MLLVPLVLSAPSVPGRGNEVVLAAGPGLAGEEDAGDPAADVEAEAEAEGEVASWEDEPTDPATAPTRKKSAKKPAGRRSTASTAKARSAALKGPGTTAVTVVAAAAKAAADPAPAPPPPSAPAPPAPSAPAPAPAPASGATTDWDRLAHCESGNTNDPGAPYYGYWQFSAGTWHALGEPGLPDEHSRDRQLAAAKRLHASRGWAPWPDCSRRLGLR